MLALGHEEVIDKAVAATCTTTGLSEGKHCSRCNKVLVKQEVVKALGHAEVIDKAAAATCTKTGLTEGKHCSRCNKVLVKQEAVKALGHKNKNGICSNCNTDISTKGLKYLDGAEKNTLILVGTGTATETDIIIPAVYEGKKVVAIGTRCFKSKTRIVSVDIPDSVTSIGDEAFMGCSSLASITIPDSVTSVGYRAFYNCFYRICNVYDNALYLGNKDNPYVVLVTAVKTIDITSCEINKKTKVICGGAFENCSRLTSITIPDSVTSIGSSAFENCSKLTSITIGNSVTSIGERAFLNCSSLTSITLPNSVTSIGSSAFV